MFPFLDFVNQSPTAFHAVAQAAAALRAAGFRPLEECEDWELLPGEGYFVTRNGSSLIAFTLPKGRLTHFQLVCSHSDSPMFKLKPQAEDRAPGNAIRLNVEVYGGGIFSTWLDRPLGIAGRVLVEGEQGIESRLVDLGRDCVLIPNMPIHFNREVNKGYAWNPQVDLLPLFAQSGETGLLAEAVKEAAQGARVLASDLFVYNRTPGTVWGPRGEFFSCPRIDNLECAYTSLQAFLQAGEAAHSNVYALFDNEEVGSSTKQGADSTFLEDVLSRICETLGMTDSRRRAAIAASFMASADNAHALHPNHPEKFDAQNRVVMNEGVVIKHNANQKYTTDGVSCALFTQICERAGVKVQHFTNRSDVPGGSTLGNIANTHVSMNTVDIGLGQLAMHSAYETAGTADADFMIQALKALYRTEIRMLGDGKFALEG